MKIAKFVNMEKLVIDIPDKRSSIVKQILQGLGVTIHGVALPVKGNYRQKLLNISAWTEDDLKVFEENKQGFNDLKAEEW
jgi:hypothetical protein